MMMSATNKDKEAADRAAEIEEQRAARLKQIRERAELLSDYDPFEYTQVSKRASGYRPLRELAGFTAAVLLVVSGQWSVASAASPLSDREERAAAREAARVPICNPDATTEPRVTRYDRRAAKWDQAPPTGLREDLRLKGETWPSVRFGPARVRNGVLEIFTSAHRSAWLTAADLPECVRARFAPAR